MCADCRSQTIVIDGIERQEGYVVQADCESCQTYGKVALYYHPELEWIGLCVDHQSCLERMSNHWSKKVNK